MNRKLFIYDNRGNALFMTLIMLTSILTVALGAANLIMPGLLMNRAGSYSIKAFYAAEAGAEKSLWEARKNTADFILPENDTPALFSSTLSNNSSYNVNFSSTTGAFTFTSSGEYSTAKRAVEVEFKR